MTNWDKNKTSQNLVWPQTKYEHCPNHKCDQTAPPPPPSALANEGRLLLGQPQLWPPLFLDKICEDTQYNFPRFLTASILAASNRAKSCFLKVSPELPTSPNTLTPFWHPVIETLWGSPRCEVSLSARSNKPNLFNSEYIPPWLEDIECHIRELMLSSDSNRSPPASQA